MRFRDYCAIFIAHLLALHASAMTVKKAPDGGSWEMWSYRGGVQSYEAGDFSTALSSFDSLAAEQVSPGLLHNLGNTEFKLGSLGPAILAWERARALDPSARNTAANLRFARGQAGLNPPSFAWHESYSAWLSPNAWTWLAALCFWGALGFLALPPLLRVRRSAWTQVGAVLTIAVFILTLPALAGLWTRSRIGVVVAEEALLRLTPTQEGEVLGKLPPGELARVELSRGGYRYVRAENDRAGWVTAQEFMRIWQQ